MALGGHQKPSDKGEGVYDLSRFITCFRQINCPKVSISSHARGASRRPIVTNKCRPQVARLRTKQSPVTTQSLGMICGKNASDVADYSCSTQVLTLAVRSGDLLVVAQRDALIVGSE